LKEEILKYHGMPYALKREEGANAGKISSFQLSDKKHSMPAIEGRI
jgi:hypothetical protein